MTLTPVIWTRYNATLTFDTGDFNVPGGGDTPSQVLANVEEIFSLAKNNISTGFLVLEHDLFAQTVDLATGYIIPDAIANGFVYRGKRIPALKGTLVFGDITTGRIWYAYMKDILAADDGNPQTMAPLHELNAGIRTLSEQAYQRRGGKGPVLPGRGAVAGAGRIDLRLAEDSNGELYVLTKGDGMIRTMVSVK